MLRGVLVDKFVFIFRCQCLSSPKQHIITFHTLNAQDLLRVGHASRRIYRIPVSLTFMKHPHPLFVDRCIYGLCAYRPCVSTFIIMPTEPSYDYVNPPNHGRLDASTSAILSDGCFNILRHVSFSLFFTLEQPSLEPLTLAFLHCLQVQCLCSCIVARIQ